MDLKAGAFIGKYQVRRKLAEGGMAEIYLCASSGPEGFQKDVVIKRIRNHLGREPEFVAMFVNEARVASRLNHPNLVHIFDFDRHEDSYFLAMEYVAGHSLLEVRRRAKERFQVVPVILAAHMAAEVAKGLDHAHRLVDESGTPVGLVHRDVTPHNILLSWNGEVKLTDFGIAKAGLQSTLPGVLKGKLGYMSPEQARGEAIDARTDIFAVGIVLWELLTGGRLFEADTDLGVLRAVQETVIVPPARLNPEVPSALDAWVMKALQRDPLLRPQTARELELGLAEFVLAHARTLSDRNVGEFLRRLYEGEVPGPEVFGRLVTPAERPQTSHTNSGAQTPDDDPLRPTEILRRGHQVSDTAILTTRPRPEVSESNADVEPPPPPRAEDGRRFGMSSATRQQLKSSLFHLALVAGMSVAGTGIVRMSQWFASKPVASSTKTPLGIDAGFTSGGNADKPSLPLKPLADVTRPSADAGTEARPAPVRSGVLALQISPWAYVYVGQSAKAIEVSHSARMNLPEGKYTLRMENPALKWSERRVVTVRADREVVVRRQIPE